MTYHEMYGNEIVNACMFSLGPLGTIIINAMLDEGQEIQDVARLAYHVAIVNNQIGSHVASLQRFVFPRGRA